MSTFEVRKRVLTIETVHHEGGPRADKPPKMAASIAVISNPFAGGYTADLMPFQAELRALGHDMATELVATLGKDNIETYGKGAIVGVDGELEHGAVWHEAGGWAMREVLGNPKAMVPASKAVAAAGFPLMVPVCYIHASFVRSHHNAMNVGLQDSPRPKEILFALVMGTGGRVHSRLGGLTKDKVSAHDGQR